MKTIVVAAMIASACTSGTHKTCQMPSAWYDKNWGLYNNVADSHIHAHEAWKLIQTSQRVDVAVIDTGIDTNHPNLANEISTTRWNFIINSDKVADSNGHGTHVSGIIEAASHDHAEIVPIEYYSSKNPGSVNLKNTIKAINFAVDHRVKIINYSGGGPQFSEDEYNALKRAEEAGILVIAAAGNEGQDVDRVDNYYYPAGYRLSNIISVMSLDINNAPLSTSNWGKVKVDVGAPGENIWSTLPDNKYGPMTGSSQATAFVSGIAALVWSQHPYLTVAQVKKIILDTVDVFSNLRDKNATSGRVNEYSAMKAAKHFTK